MGDQGAGPDQGILTDRHPGLHDRATADLGTGVEPRRRQRRLSLWITPDQPLVVDRAHASTEEHPVGQHALVRCEPGEQRTSRPMRVARSTVR